MASIEEFAPGFAHDMQQQQIEVADEVAAVGSLVFVAREFWPYGTQVVEFIVRHLAGEKGVDPEEVFARVGWQKPHQLQQQQPQPQQQAEADDSSTGSGSGLRKQLGFDEIRLTPKEPQEQAQQAAAAALSTFAMGRFGYVAKEVQKYDVKQIVHIEDDQTYHKTAAASVQIGNGQTGVQQQQPLNGADDFFQTNPPFSQGMTERQQLQAQLATSNATIKQLQDQGNI